LLGANFIHFAVRDRSAGTVGFGAASGAKPAASSAAGSSR